MAAPSINGFGGGSSLTPGASPLAWTQNIGTPGSNARLYFGISQADASDSVTAVTWNGSAMTRLATARPAELQECDIWYIDTPSSGAHDFSISFSGDGTYGGTVWWVLVDDAGTHGTPFTVTGTGTSVDSGSQTCPTNGMVLVFALHNFSSSAPTSTAGTDIGLSMPVNRRPVAGYRLSTGNVSWTFGSSQAWGLVGVTIAEVGGGSPELDIDADAVALAGSIAVSGDIQIGTSFDLASSAVALAGALAVSGDIQITEAPELDLDPATLALAGALSVSGDIEIGTSHDLAADPVALSGALAVSGDIEASVDPVLDIDAAAIALAGSLGVSGDIDIGTSFDLAATAVALAGNIGVSGNIQASTGPLFVMPAAERLVREPAEPRFVVEPAETRFIPR